MYSWYYIEMENQIIADRKLIGFIDLLRSSLSFYKNHYREIGKASILPIGVNLIFSIFSLLISIFFPSLSSNVWLILLLVIGQIITALIAFIVMIFTYTTLVFRIKSADENIIEPIKETYKKSLKLFWPYVWVLILAQLAVLGGLFLLIIPGILLAVYLLFYKFSLIVDGQRGLDALCHSFYYAKNNFWKIFLRLIGMGLIIFIFFLVLGLIGVGIYLLAGGQLSWVEFSETVLLFQQFPISSVLSFSMSIIYWVVITPISLIFSFLLFKDLKTRKLAPELPAAYATSRNWFKGFSILGLCLSAIFLLFLILALFIPFLLGVVKGFEEASQANNNVEFVQSVFPAQTIPFAVLDESKIEKKPFENYGEHFSIRLPKGWNGVEEAGGGYATPPLKSKLEVGMIFTIQPLTLASTDMLEEEIIEEVAQEKLTIYTGLKDLVFQKFSLPSGIVMYVVGGDYFSNNNPAKPEDPSVTRHYFVRDGLKVYEIIVNSDKEIWPDVENSIIQSVMTFKII